MELRSGCGCLVAVVPDDYAQAIAWTQGTAIGNPKEKIRIEPMEVPVPSKTPVEAPAETPEKEPVR